MLGHKISLNKFKRIEIISGIFSDHNPMRLGINYRKNKKHKGMEAKQNKQQIAEDAKGNKEHAGK